MMLLKLYNVMEKGLQCAKWIFPMHLKIFQLKVVSDHTFVSNGEIFIMCMLDKYLAVDLPQKMLIPCPKPCVGLPAIIMALKQSFII